MQLVYLKRFVRHYARLAKDERAAIDKSIQRMHADLRHPSLRVKKVKGTADIWEARASRDLRITFSVQPGKVTLRACGHHDDALRNP